MATTVKLYKIIDFIRGKKPMSKPLIKGLPHKFKDDSGHVYVTTKQAFDISKDSCQVIVKFSATVNGEKYGETRFLSEDIKFSDLVLECMFIARDVEKTIKAWTNEMEVKK